MSQLFCSPKYKECVQFFILFYFCLFFFFCFIFLFIINILGPPLNTTSMFLAFQLWDVRIKHVILSVKLIIVNICRQGHPRECNLQLWNCSVGSFEWKTYSSEPCMLLFVPYCQIVFFCVGFPGIIFIGLCKPFGISISYVDLMKNFLSAGIGPNKGEKCTVFNGFIIGRAVRE